MIALDAATGKLKWKFDSGLHSPQPARGVTYWTDGEQRANLCRGNELSLLPRRSNRQTDRHLRRSGPHRFAKAGSRRLRGSVVALTTPGIIYKDLIIVGGRNPETHPAPPGDIRAFDVRTGELRWIFHTIPLPGEPGYETWPNDAWKTAAPPTTGQAWRSMPRTESSMCQQAPRSSTSMAATASATTSMPTHCSRLMPIPARSCGISRAVHHDIWDRDFPAQPALYDFKQNGKTVEGLAQITKQAICISSIGSLDSLSFRSTSFLTPPALFPANHLFNPAQARRARAVCPPATDRRHADHAHP